MLEVSLQLQWSNDRDKALSAPLCGCRSVNIKGGPFVMPGLQFETPVPCDAGLGWE